MSEVLDNADEQSGISNDSARQEAIARRAYEISLSEGGGTSEENWYRAVEEFDRQQPAVS
jgi:hypothetical protein